MKSYTSKKHGVIFWGDDFAFQNAAQQYSHMESVIDECNKLSKTNIELVQSTPQTYVNALKEENLEFPVRSDDLQPYKFNSQQSAGYFASHATFKKQVKDVSMELGAHSSLFARRLIDQNVTQDEVDDIMDANFHLLDPLAIA